MTAIDLLQPVFVMGLLSVVMAVWVVVTRIPAMMKARIPAEEAWHTGTLPERLPKSVVQVADNYNHLFEQPTVFYAVALAIVALGHVDALHVQCAWGYTVLRIAHSLVQATVNIVMVRFSLFLAAWVVLAIMIIRELVASIG